MNSKKLRGRKESLPIKTLEPINSDEDEETKKDEISKITSAFRESMRKTVSKMNEYEKINDSGKSDKSDSSRSSGSSSNRPAERQRKKSILHNPGEKWPDTTRKKSVR
jgi:hypothetical protein